MTRVYIVRLELLCVSPLQSRKIYERLEQDMEKAGLYRYIDLDERTYYLPDGTYVCYHDGTISPKKVREDVRAIALKTNHGHTILVVKASSIKAIAWDNLVPAI